MSNKKTDIDEFLFNWFETELFKYLKSEKSYSDISIHFKEVGEKNIDRALYDLWWEKSIVKITYSFSPRGIPENVKSVDDVRYKSIKEKRDE